jgi:hypothetical protein
MEKIRVCGIMTLAKFYLTHLDFARCPMVIVERRGRGCGGASSSPPP